MINNLGYACINMDLSDRPKGKRITTIRTCRKASLDFGTPHPHRQQPKFANWHQSPANELLSTLSEKNTSDLIKIINWNAQAGIKFFRISSDLFPWSSNYNLSDLPDFAEICDVLQEAGDYIEDHGHRITSHPGPFNKLASPKERVFQLTKTD